MVVELHQQNPDMLEQHVVGREIRLTPLGTVLHTGEDKQPVEIFAKFETRVG